MIIMGSDKKRTVNQILGDDPRLEKEGAPEEGASDHEALAQEMIDYLDAGDAKGLAECLKSFFTLCNSEGPVEEAE